ncbi:MAG: hypothetical protein AABZ31_15190 [Bdellovibrionota bacterium]
MKLILLTALFFTALPTFAKNKYEREAIISAHEAIQMIEAALVHQLNVGEAIKNPCGVSYGYSAPRKGESTTYQVLLKNQGLNTQYFTFPVNPSAKIQLVQTDFRTWTMTISKSMESEDPETGASRGQVPYDVVLVVDNRYPNGTDVHLTEFMTLDCHID